MKNRNIIALSILTGVVLSGCVSKTTEVKYNDDINHNRVVSSSKFDSPKNLKFKKTTYGKASWYGKKFNGKKTASGELYDMYKKTAAHKTLPFNTMVRVTDMVTNKSDIVRINDRGPYSGGRAIDLSYASAKKIGLVERGVTDVKIEIVGSDGKVDGRLTKTTTSVALPSSTKACVGNDCVATLGQEDSCQEESPKALSAWADKRVRRESSYRGFIQSVDSFSSSQPSYSNPSTFVSARPNIDSYNSKRSIQVGAFRKYKGAETYAKRYSLLNRQYKTVIKNEMKDNKPIYRVRIEGFSNDNEAKKFIAQNSLNEAFLVRR